MNRSTDVQDVTLIQAAGKQIPIVISDMTKQDAQRAAASLREQGHVVMSAAEAAEARILPVA